MSPHRKLTNDPTLRLARAVTDDLEKWNQSFQEDCVRPISEPSVAPEDCVQPISGNQLPQKIVYSQYQAIGSQLKSSPPTIWSRVHNTYRWHPALADATDCKRSPFSGGAGGQGFGQSA
ncbi:hypothetical protein RRG08_066489 [Elysia crispata]|uniref:Uncharacterized protein n=1 Tax=Elysia crispata TaxID=231223 RepID=A0AAE1DQD3_9GAST|nr:hypothetical protein RRG08_066489 [Elysia crispata]